ncbi:MAG TPA: hypothetical protein VLW50_29135 [Streptosporangiaceae bacterium]|nr:hypothetical protein [Streptosporangiaceae bacterium]
MRGLDDRQYHAYRLIRKHRRGPHDTDHRHYILTVKANMPSLERDIAALFPAGPADNGAFPPQHITIDRGHGRSEIRSIWCSPDVASLDFSGAYQAFRIHRRIYDPNWSPLPETVHGITSRTAWQANPADILASNGGHREVENREHHVRDRTFDEDRSQVKRAHRPSSWPPPATSSSACSGPPDARTSPAASSTPPGALITSWRFWASYRNRSEKSDAYAATLPMTLAATWALKSSPPAGNPKHQ